MEVLEGLDRAVESSPLRTIPFTIEAYKIKEKLILFRDLDEKNLSAEHRKIMNELIDEHKFGRRTTQSLVDTNARYRAGDTAALADIAAKLTTLVNFYPPHIEKEDKVFFPASRAYFTDAEDQAMLAEFWEFDRLMIHEKYKTEIQELEK